MNLLKERPIEIDGSYGEGGGQILRTALALSAILKRPFALHHIRSKRKNPGLQAQHLQAVEALARITKAQTEGVQFGSETISFIPQEIFSGDYQFAVRTAGSVTLLSQAIFLPLCFAKEASEVTLIGGTHVPWSPSFHYLDEVLLPTIKRMGIYAEAAIDEWGFYPRGGGRIRLKINPIHELKSISLLDRGRLKEIRGLSAISRLPKHVGERQRKQALKRIREELKIDGDILLLSDVPSNEAGSFVFIRAEYEQAFAGFSSLGSRGKSAEKVADEAVDSLIGYIQQEGCIDPYLADQLVPFMTLAKGNSCFTTTQMSNHLLTNLWVVSQFLDVKMQKFGEKEGPGRIEFLNE